MSLSITINGTEYDLAANLRVAYEFQGQMNHTPYLKLFSTIPEMALEDQIKLLYVSFKVANRDVAKTITSDKFRDIILDDNSFNTSILMQKIKEVVGVIAGQDLDEQSSKEEENSSSGNE